MIGSIDLRGSNPEVLKPNLFEGQDYVLLPANSANALILKYKANPYTFCRVVVNMGSAENKLLQIELYPVELYFYTCTKDKPTVGPNDTPALLLVSKKEDVSTFISRRQQQQNIKVGTRIRVWLKTSELPEALPAGNLGGRLMTSDVTDREGSWMLIRNVEGLKMADLLDDQPNLTIILEYYEVPFVNTNKDTSPRAQFLNAWKKSITVGDMIDVEDKTKKWREAVVTKISDDGCLSVHFKGYISTNDEKILKSEINDRVAPLNTKTVGWRTKRLEDSSIDINIEEPGFAVKWVTGVVQEVNLVTSKVKVEVNKSEWDDYQYNKIS